MDFANLAAQLNAGTILPSGIVTHIISGQVLVADLWGASSSPVPYVALAGLLGSLIALYHFQRDATNPVSFLALLTVNAL